MSFNLSFER